MKAREIKKTVLHYYEEQTKSYKETISHNVQDMAVRQAEIKLLENMLLTCFGIDKVFDFNFVYPRGIKTAKQLLEPEVDDVPF